MLRIFAFILIVFAIGSTALFFVFARPLGGLISGNPPWPSEISAARDFVPTVYGQLRQAIENTGSVAKIPSKYTPPSHQPSGHIFWGSTATNKGGVCLVSAKSAYRSTSFGLKDRSGIRFPSPQQFYGCNDFFRTTPPEVPLDILDYGKVDEPVRHFCAPVLAEGIYTIWENTDKPTGHISIATVFQGLSIDDILEVAAENQKVLQVGGDDAGNLELTASDLFALSKVTTFRTLSCNGFDVFHVSIEAKSWPPGK